MNSRVQQSDFSAHPELGLLHLPHELLIHIFKAQTSFRDVSRLSQACSLLYKVSHSNAHAIANAIFQQPSIPVQEAIDLIKLHRRADYYRFEFSHRCFLPARGIANFTTRRLLSCCYDEVVRLAEGELFATSSDAAQYNPTSFILTRRCLFGSPVTTTGIDAHIAGGINYFRLYQCIFTNMQESVCALVLAATQSIPRTRRVDSKCSFHPWNALLPHEITRFFSTWYWFKLYLLSNQTRGFDGLKQTLDVELKSMNHVQARVYFGIINFLFYGLEEEHLRKLGMVGVIRDLTTHETYIGPNWYDGGREFGELRDNIMARCEELEMLVDGMRTTLDGCFDVCNGEGSCKPRDENKGIWEE